MKTIEIRAGRFLLLAMLLATIVGCGQKGNLYLPDEPDRKQDFVTH